MTKQRLKQLNTLCGIFLNVNVLPSTFSNTIITDARLDFSNQISLSRYKALQDAPDECFEGILTSIEPDCRRTLVGIVRPTMMMAMMMLGDDDVRAELLGW